MSNPSTPTHLQFWGASYQILFELSGGYYLIAHPNGPAICNGDWLRTIDQIDDDHPELIKIKRQATRHFREWAWPQLVSQLTFADSVFETSSLITSH